MKILNTGNIVNVVLSDGQILTKSFPMEEINSVLSLSEDEIVELFTPKKAQVLQEIEEVKKERKTLEDIVNQAEESEILEYKGNSFYIPSVSELTVPIDLVKSILKAERKGKEEKVQSYLRFWTLACLNPDSRVRNNLFWFLKKYGITISSSGLFIGYRNVQIASEGSKFDADMVKAISALYVKIKKVHKKSPKKYHVGFSVKAEDKLIATKNLDKIEASFGTLQECYDQLSDVEVSTVYTDAYTRTFKIKLGEPVEMDRNKCDSKQENTCSRGLHLASAEWLESNYLGNTPLMVLCSPTDVVAVPPQDSYGKLRTCRYFPVKVVEFDEEDNIINDTLEDGFEDDFYNYLTYQGQGDTEEIEQQVLQIPDIPEIQVANILSRLDEAKESLKNKVYGSRED